MQLLQKGVVEKMAHFRNGLQIPEETTVADQGSVTICT